MTKQLYKGKTFFLSFNKGNDGGCGNPIAYNNYRTSYLWKDVLKNDSLPDILYCFVFIKKEYLQESTGEVIKKRETVIFPRYHQLDVV